MITRTFEVVSRCLGTAILLVAPAAAVAQNDSASTYVRPQGTPVSASTNFDASLRCMDELLSRTRYGVGNVIYARSLDEGKGSGSVTRDMIVASLGRMSEKSRIFRINIDPSEAKLLALPSTDLVVGGSITAFEQDVTAKGSGAGLTLGPLGFGFQNNKRDSIMSVTVYLQDGKGFVLPSTTQSLSMTLRSRDKGGDISGGVGLVSGFATVNFSGGDAPLQAVRALIDLALIQSVGAWAQIPYQRCLAVAQTDTAGIREARRAFDKMKPGQQISLIAAALSERGIYRGPPATAMTPELRRAISEYQAQQQLPSLGLPTFELYFALYGDRYGTAATPAVPAIVDPGNGNPLGVRVTPYGPAFVADSEGHFQIALGYRASFAVTATRPGNLLCYYTDARQRTTKVFPNSQRRSATIRAGDQIVIPGPGDIFSIAPEVPDSNEQLTCLASAQPLERFVPAALLADFGPGTPPLPIRSGEELLAKIRPTAPADLSTETLNYHVFCLDPTTGEGKKCA